MESTKNKENYHQNDHLIWLVPPIKALEVGEQPSLSVAKLLYYKTCLSFFSGGINILQTWRQHLYMMPSSVDQSDMHSTGDQEVMGSIPTGSGNILSWRFLMQYFLRSFPIS